VLRKTDILGDFRLSSYYTRDNEMIAAPLVSHFVVIRQHSENSNLAFDNRITEEGRSIQTRVYGEGRDAYNAPADLESVQRVKARGTGPSW